MFVIVTDNNLTYNPIVDAKAIKSLCGYTVWVSQYILQKHCGLSDRYFENVRSKYKRNLPVSPAIIYLDSPLLGYILSPSNNNWRWMLYNGFYYDYDRIPWRYRQLIPAKRELVFGLVAK